MNMKINYIMAGTNLTGGVRVLLEIANKLVERGHEVTITSFGDKKDHCWYPLRAKTVYIRRSPLKMVLGYLSRKYVDIGVYPNQEYFDLARSIPECDINVATFCFTAFSAFMSGKGKLFYHMQHHEPLFFDDPIFKRLAEETYYLPLNKISNSIWLRNQMRELYGYDTPVVNPAIDHSVFYPRDVNRDTNKFKILCFGKQTRWKGFPEVLDAIKTVTKNRGDVEFVAYGMNKPKYPSDIPYKFIQSPSDEELARLYSSADLMVCPSWYESFPLFPLEAMACGAPVITTPYGTEDYAFHEENCLVVPPRDPKAMSEAILALLDDEDERERFKKEGIRTAKQFTWDNTTDKVEQLFRDALKDK
ncbi:MAG: D-inositol-3-phosphate glycosyltransferase [Methanosaeta sp. PtaU1.Bin112]|nr:MAG: D-inositol-3-phosphate glycosyltransferase [Methanosaeta sp. PtaU1.Bin112]